MPSIFTRKLKLAYGLRRWPGADMPRSSLALADLGAVGRDPDPDDDELGRVGRPHADLDVEPPERAFGLGVQRLVDAHVERVRRRRPEQRAVAPDLREERVDGAP